MSKWQAIIYRGKHAQIIKEEYRNLLAVKKSEEDAERIIVEECMRDIVPGSMEEGRMWLALALWQWERGRLSVCVKAQALHWLKQPIVGIDTAVLDNLNKTLQSPMPPKRRISLPPWVAQCPWPVGSLLAYRIISNEDGDVKNSPYWGKYVLLRIIAIRRSPVTQLAPNAAYNETMLVGLYNWCGKEIPDASIVKRLDFTPIFVADPTAKSTIGTLESLSRSRAMRVETCCALAWRCAKGINTNDVFTYLGCDPSFQDTIPDLFKTAITEYSFAHSIPFDSMLFNRLKQLSKTTENT